MNIPMAHHDRVRWLTAAPLWSRAVEVPATATRMGEPAILRFKGDNFMDQARAALNDRPEDLSRHVVRPESWEREQAGWQSSPGTEPVTLFQPIHNRFYLASATLVCQRPGLPDRSLSRVAGDTVSLLVRRLVPRGNLPLDATDPARHLEQAWVGTAQTGRWVTLDNPTLPASGEERLPMFPMPYAEGERSRCLHAAVIPVARANGYASDPGEVQARASAAETVNDHLGDPREAELRDGLLRALDALADLNIPGTLPADVELDQLRQARSGLVLALLDLGLFLQREIPRIHTVLRGSVVAGITTEEQALLTRLTGTQLGGGFTAAQIIDRAMDREDRFDTGTPSDSLLATVLGTSPTAAQIASFSGALNGAASTLLDLILPLLSDARAARLRDLGVAATDRIAAEAALSDTASTATAILRELLALDDLLAREVPDLAAALPAGPPPAAADAPVFARFGTSVAPGITWGAALTEARRHAAEILSDLQPRTAFTTTATTPAALAGSAASFFAALDTVIGTSLTARPLPAVPPVDITADTEAPDPVYVLRMVYERPACAGIHPPSVSAPSRPVRFAGFYDANAPVRALKIEMPSRTSVADFRKTPRNVAFQLSKELRKQISRVRSAKLSDPLEDQLGGGGSFDLGVICSLSIPIITICALILLMIIVQLLNIVFWWLPYFMICFPVKKS